MKQYIDKDDFVAEIERIKKEECPIDVYEVRTKLFYFERFLSFINTLEVKEVDLEKEIDDYWCSLFCDYKMKRVAFHKFVPVPAYIDEKFNQCENGKTKIAYILETDWKTDFNDIEWNADDIIEFARYFYELGLKSKGE